MFDQFHVRVTVIVWHSVGWFYSCHRNSGYDTPKGFSRLTSRIHAARDIWIFLRQRRLHVIRWQIWSNPNGSATGFSRIRSPYPLPVYRLHKSYSILVAFIPQYRVFRRLGDHACGHRRFRRLPTFAYFGLDLVMVTDAVTDSFLLQLLDAGSSPCRHLHTTGERFRGHVRSSRQMIRTSWTDLGRVDASVRSGP
jgi:hypothetical protein